MDVALEKYINDKINRLYTSYFEGPLNKDNSFSIHERNIQSLAIKIYRFLNGLSPGFLNNVSHKSSSNPYALWNRQELYFRNPKTVRYGTETVLYMAPNIWSKVSKTIKIISSLETRICPSPLCKIFAICWFR